MTLARSKVAPSRRFIAATALKKTSQATADHFGYWTGLWIFPEKGKTEDPIAIFSAKAQPSHTYLAIYTYNTLRLPLLFLF
jgi:hypothetical protein